MRQENGFTTGIARRLTVMAGKICLAVSIAVGSEAGTPVAAEVAPNGLLPRIVGGVPVSIEAAPSTVALLSASTYSLTGSMRRSQFCGATLITDTWLLTAAHCLLDAQNRTVPVTSILAVAGTTDLEDPDTQPVAIDSLVIHPAFIDVTTGFDIALLRLAAPANAPAAVLDNSPLVINDEALIAGWGTLRSQGVDEDPDLAPGLQAARVLMVPGEDCDEIFPSNQGITTKPVTSAQICAAINGGGVDTCQGDSGGPLYRIADDDELTLIGVVSFGVGCGLNGYPGIYTNIATHRSFVTTTINDNPTVNTTSQVGNLPEKPDENVDLVPALPGTGGSFLVLPLLCLGWLARRFSIGKL